MSGQCYRKVLNPKISITLLSTTQNKSVTENQEKFPTMHPNCKDQKSFSMFLFNVSLFTIRHSLTLSKQCSTPCILQCSVDREIVEKNLKYHVLNNNLSYFFGEKGRRSWEYANRIFHSHTLAPTLSPHGWIQEQKMFAYYPLQIGFLFSILFHPNKPANEEENPLRDVILILSFSYFVFFFNIFD